MPIEEIPGDIIAEQDIIIMLGVILILENPIKTIDYILKHLEGLLVCDSYFREHDNQRMLLQVYHEFGKYHQIPSQSLMTYMASIKNTKLHQSKWNNKSKFGNNHFLLFCRDTQIANDLVDLNTYDLVVS